jgi:PAS domain S-box-containing protein
MFSPKTWRLPIPPTRAVYLLALLTVIAIAISVSLLLANLREQKLEETREETASLTHMLMEQTGQAFAGVDQALEGVQERLQTNYGHALALDSLPVHLLLTARSFGMQQVSGFFIVNTDGLVVSSSRQFPAERRAVDMRDYYKVFANGKKSGLFVGNPVRSLIDGAWTLHLARRLDGPDGKFRGVVVARIKLEHFEQLYGYMKLDFVRPIALYRDDGRLVVSLPRRDGEIGYPALELQAWQIPLAENKVRMVTHVGGNNSREVFALGRVTGFPLLVGVTNDEEVALAAWRETAVPITLGAILVSIFTIIAAALLARKLRREEALDRALREADDRYLRTIDTVMDAIVAIDSEQKITLFNRSAESMFGIPASDAIGTPLATLIPEHLREGHGGNIDEFMRSGVGSRSMAAQIEVTGRRADGSEFPIESTISQTLIDGKPQLTAVLRDITERRRAEARVLEANKELRRLSTTLQSVREEERTRISRELHDELGQQLTGIKLDLSWLSSRLKDGRPAAPDKVDSMRHLLDTAIASVRRISSELRPRILDDLGFGEAVSWQAGEFAKRSGIDVNLDLKAAPLVHDDATATALFRIVQESLTNVARHADASRVDIGLVAEGNCLVLRVKDNGKGLAADHNLDGIGLVSMRERTAVLGGRFSISGAADAGTTIEVRVPVEALTAGAENA